MMALFPLSLSLTLLAGPAAEPLPEPSAPPADDAWASPSAGKAPAASVPDPAEVQERTGTDFGTPDQAAATRPEPPPAQPGGSSPAQVPPPAAGALGHGAMTPLPPPPARVDPSTIEAGPWRGDGWLDVRLRVIGPLGGDGQARSNAVAWGGGLAAGWRINNWVGIAGGFTRGPHYVRERTYDVDGLTVRERYVEYLTAFDVFGRFFVPVQGRVQPWADAGLAFALREQGTRPSRPLGGLQVRGALGTDFWVARSFTIGLGVIYRLTYVDESTGHQLGGTVDLGFHW